MLTIEVCLEQLDVILWLPPECPTTRQRLEITNNWDRRFISDINSHLRDKKPISTAQGELAMKMITRYRTSLEANGVPAVALDALIAAPAYRLAPHQSVDVPREVRWLGNSKLAFRCKYNPIVIDELKKLKSLSLFEEGYPMFDREWKLWIVDVDRSNLERVMELIRRHRFTFDPAVEHFFLNCVNAKGQASTADLVGDQIVIQVNDDEFLNSWLGQLQNMEDYDV